MKDIVEDTDLIASCGLYCAACSKYLKEKCPCCSNNEKATWCKVRSCCIEKDILSCADCAEYTEVMDCEKYNNLFAKVFGFVFRSDRSACIRLIKDNGYDHFATVMAESRQRTIKK